MVFSIIIIPYKNNCCILFKGLSYMYVIINYNKYTICIRNTERSKSMPLMCTHVYSYMFSTVHPLRRSYFCSKGMSHFCDDIFHRHIIVFCFSKQSLVEAQHKLSTALTLCWKFEMCLTMNMLKQGQLSTFLIRNQLS